MKNTHLKMTKKESGAEELYAAMLE